VLSLGSFLEHWTCHLALLFGFIDMEICPFFSRILHETIIFQIVLTKRELKDRITAMFGK